MAKAKRRADLERDVARVVDPFSEAARLWSAREAQRRQASATKEREAIAVVGRRRIAGDDGRSPIGSLVQEPAWGETPEHTFRIGRDRVAGAPVDPPRESVLEMLARRRRELHGERYEHVSRPRQLPVQDAASAAREQVHRRASRAAYEASRPSGVSPSDAVPSRGRLPVAVTHNVTSRSRAGALLRGALHWVSPPARADRPLTVAEIEREVAAIAGARWRR